MPLHDDYLRATPYERTFPDPETRDRVLDAIHDEVQQRGMGADDPGAFALLGRTREALAELRDPEGGDDGGHTHAILFFHVFHLRQAGGEHLLASVPVIRWAIEAADIPGEPDPGGLPDAAYVQLPQHLFWVREDPDGRPLSLDGFFWTVTGDTLHLLGVMDLQSGGRGIRVLALPGVPYAERTLWLTDGTLARVPTPNHRLPDLKKISAGYHTGEPLDLVDLFIGSEGTLGIITEAILKVVPMPESVKTLMVTFDNLDNTAKAVTDIIGSGIIPAAMELMDKMTLNAIEDSADLGLDKAAAIFGA